MDGEGDIMAEGRDNGRQRLECTCRSDELGPLPPEMWPGLKKEGGLRKVTCPGCGLVYKTNRETDLCMECTKKQG